MALRALQGPAGGAAPVGGTGTTNTIPRWTGASTLGDSGLIDDSTSIYTSTRRVGVDTSTTLANVKLQVGTAASLANYQGAPLGVVLPAGSGSWLELAENSASGTSFRISKDSSTGVVLNTNGKTIGFTAAGYTTAVASSQVVLTTSGNVGIGVIPSAWASSVRAEEMRTHARWNYNSGSDSVAYWTVNAFLNSAGNAIYKATAAASQYTQIGGAHVWERAVSGTAGNTVTWLESARIDSAGTFGIGTTSPDSRLHVTLAGLASLRIGYAGTSVNYYDAGTHNFRDGGGNPAFTITAGATKIADLSVSGWGLKLPATPGNGNANTLDSYQEGTRVLSAGDLSGWTYVTATQYWTLVGRTVTLHTVFTGGTSSATGGATIATPPLLTPLRIAAGAAVNSSGTALGNGVCVCGPSTATTGVVQTSNAISSSAVDKVITVTYETAGL